MDNSQTIGSFNNYFISEIALLCHKDNNKGYEHSGKCKNSLADMGT